MRSNANGSFPAITGIQLRRIPLLEGRKRQIPETGAQVQAIIGHGERFEYLCLRAGPVAERLSVACLDCYAVALALPSGVVTAVARGHGLQETVPVMCPVGLPTTMAQSPH